MPALVTSLTAVWKNWAPSPLAGEATVDGPIEARFLWGELSRLVTAKSGLGLTPRVGPPITMLKAGQRVVLCRLTHYNNFLPGNALQAITLELTFTFARHAGSDSYELTLLHTEADDVHTFQPTVAFPHNVTLSGDIALRILGFAYTPTTDTAEIHDTFESEDAAGKIEGRANDCYLVAEVVSAADEDERVCTPELAVFKPELCEVPCVLPIIDTRIIEDCSIPEDMPEPISDCPELDLPLYVPEGPSQTLRAFELLVKICTVDGFGNGADAQLYNPDTGEKYGDPVLVRADVVTDRFGPAKVGWRGWAMWQDQDGGSDPCRPGTWQIVDLQHFARYIRFTGAQFTLGCLVPAAVVEYWDGEDPSDDNVWVFAGENCATGACGSGDGIAVLNERKSTLCGDDPKLIYEVVELTAVRMGVADSDTCADDCPEGEKVSTLAFGDYLVASSCTMPGGIDDPCARKVDWEGFELSQVGCPLGEPPRGDTIQLLAAAYPLVSGSLGGICPKAGYITITGDAIVGEETPCILVDVQWVDCQWHIYAYLDITLEAGDCMRITENEETCTWRFDVDMDLVGAPGVCTTTSVTETSPCYYTISTDVDISIDGGSGTCTTTTVSGGPCDFTVKTDVDMTISPGTCIDVQKGGACNYTISFEKGAETCATVLCDIDIVFTPITIECVEDPSTGEWSIQSSGGGITVTKYYSTICVANCAGSVTSGCGGSTLGESLESTSFSSRDYNSECLGYETPVPTMSITTGEFGCAETEESIPEGWVECKLPLPQVTQGFDIVAVDRNEAAGHLILSYLGAPTYGSSAPAETAQIVISVVGRDPIAYEIDLTELVAGQGLALDMAEGDDLLYAGDCFHIRITYDNDIYQDFTGCCG